MSDTNRYALLAALVERHDAQPIDSSVAILPGGTAAFVGELRELLRENAEPPVHLRDEPRTT